MTLPARVKQSPPGGTSATAGLAVSSALLYFAMVALTLMMAGLAVRYLPAGQVRSWRGPAGVPWLEGLCRWDAAWFAEIASKGYWLDPARQSPVAFYPLYPLLMRAFKPVVGYYLLAGIIITMLSGLGAVLLIHRWCRARLDADAARLSLWVLLLYPFSLFLFGAVYSDALFVLVTAASFTSLEGDRPWLAGLLGAAATAARPVGLAVVVGLAVRAAERRGVLGAPGRRSLHLERLQPADAGVLISVVGMSLYWCFLWLRFDDPLAWVHAAAAPGWNVEPGPRAWFKVVLFSELMAPWNVSSYVRLMHVALCLVGFATIPAVWRRFGIGYGTYVLAVIGIPAVSSPDFFGAGRYLLPAFPCFAIAATYLAARPRLARVALPVSAVAQTLVTALFAAWYPVA